MLREKVRTRKQKGLKGREKYEEEVFRYVKFEIK